MFELKSFLEDCFSATKKTLGTICEEKGISSGFQVSISSRYDLSCQN